MFGKRLFWQIFAPFVLIYAFSLIVFLQFYSGAMEEFYLNHLEMDLKVRAKLVQMKLENAKFLKPLNRRKLDEFCKKMNELTSCRISVIDRGGKVLCDTAVNTEYLVNHAGRPEIKEAYNGNVGSRIRFSSSVNRQMIYAAAPVRINGRIPYVFRLSIPTRESNLIIWLATRPVFFFSLLAIVLAGIVTLFVAVRMNRVVNELQGEANKIAEGDFSRKLPLSEGPAGELTRSLSIMTESLKSLLLDTIHRKNESDAILATMSDGIIAIDPEATILNINEAAVSLLHAPVNPVGRTFHEVVRNSGIQDFADNVLKNQKSLCEEFILYKDAELYLRISGSPLRNFDGSLLGALIVLTDITEIRKLENLRRDFVANVSHEIRTPLTAILGSVESLEEGALEDPRMTQRFMGIIKKHGARLNALVEDLLCLSAIEKENAQEEFALSEAAMSDVINSAAELCRHKSSTKNIDLKIDCPGDVNVKLDRHRFEQVLVNLIDNAIKYSNENDVVEINAEEKDNKVFISVKDHGCGIAKEHIKRLFERFYRVDKARSRKLGGTGLGLAIVKHIVQMHNGKIMVDSAPGKGTTFTIVLPQGIE